MAVAAAEAAVTFLSGVDGGEDDDAADGGGGGTTTGDWLRQLLGMPG